VEGWGDFHWQYRHIELYHISWTVIDVVELVVICTATPM